MAECVNCAVTLKFNNTPNLRAGKLSTGETLCFGCFSKLSSTVSPRGIKKLTADDAVAKLKTINANMDRIKEQIKGLGLSKLSSLLGRNEIAELPNLVSPSENIIGVVQGSYNKGAGLLVATDKRLLFVDKGMVSLKTEDFPISKINSIQFEAGYAFATIKIATAGNVAAITNVDKADGKNFVDTARYIMDAPPPQPVSQAAPLDIAEQLQKFAALKEQGILSEEEFNTQKKKLLGL